jgi:hypothetical protein
MKRVLLFMVLMAFLLVAGCSSKQAINFKVHSEPAGAHVILQNDGSRWVYLGMTPLDISETFSGDQLEDGKTVTMRIMRCGYLDQTKGWSGEEIIDEIDTKDAVLWTPRLIKAEE